MSVEGKRALIISRYALDCRQYNESLSDVTWETCSLRKWLNNDFINTAFSSTEKSKIPTVTLENKDNPVNNTPGGNKTKDKIFCLSAEEMNEYYAPHNWSDNGGTLVRNQKLICAPTKYAISKGVIETIISEEAYEVLKNYGYTPDVIGCHGCNWWLRSPGLSSLDANLVEDDGMSGVGFCNYVYRDYAVRPALYFEY